LQRICRGDLFTLAQKDPNLAKTIANKQTENAKLRDYSDEELRKFIREAKSADKSYDEVVSAIESDTIKSNVAILNKDRAKLIAREIFGVKERPKLLSLGERNQLAGLYTKLRNKTITADEKKTYDQLFSMLEPYAQENLLRGLE